MTEEEKLGVKRLYPWCTNIYGPYHRKDGRKHVVLSYPSDGGTRRTSVSYSKLLVELHLGKRLGFDETVDHIDRDFTNDDLSNLRVVDRRTHGREDALWVKVPNVSCTECRTIFSPSRCQIATRARLKAGPFCSKSCSGKYGKRVQLGKEISSREVIPVTYYRINKT